MSLILAGLIFVTGYVEPGVTASGVITHPGTAACPPDVPFGSRIGIEGVGEVVCEDAYSPRLGPRIDVYVPSVADAYAITGQRRVWLITDDQITE